MRETQQNRALRKLAEAHSSSNIREIATKAGIDFMRLKRFYRRSVNELYPEEHTKLERVL